MLFARANRARVLEIERYKVHGPVGEILTTCDNSSCTTLLSVALEIASNTQKCVCLISQYLKLVGKLLNYNLCLHLLIRC